MYQNNYNLSPQGDGNPFGLVVLDAVCLITIYPRKGTETAASTRANIATGELQFIPARGRKPVSFSFFVFCFSPLQFIPARGRKLNSSSHLVKFSTITIYPRKGTETQHFCHRHYKSYGLQFIPARGRKLWACCFISLSGWNYNLSPQGDGNGLVCVLDAVNLITIYPRKGTEPSSTLYTEPTFILQFIPARGRKLQMS